MHRSSPSGTPGWRQTSNHGTIVYSGDGEPTPDALVRDPKAVELVGQLDYDFSGVQRPKGDQVSFLLRMREFDKPALRQHYEEGILPSLALYQTLREECDNQEAALEEMDRIIAAQVARSGRRRWCRFWAACPIRSRSCGFSIAGR